MRATDYLASSFRPDREFLDGLLLDRSLGEYEHSNLQGALITWLRNRQREWNIRALPEQRIQVSTGRYRVPDVCVISRDQTIEPVFTRPPLVCIEILSKDLRRTFVSLCRSCSPSWIKGDKPSGSFFHFPLT